MAKLQVEYIDEDNIPKEGNGYVFLDLNNPIVLWETSIGCLYSSLVDYELDNLSRPSMWISNIIYNKNYSKLINELIIDNIRNSFFPDKVSRLKGIFFFRDLDSTKSFLKWGGQFTLHNLSEIYYFSKYDVTRCDSNWITNADLDNKGIIKQSYHDSIKAYWSGIQCPRNEFPIWEYIIHGVINITSQFIKAEAFNNVLHLFPKSKETLLTSILAPHYHMNFGHITPYISPVNKNEYKLGYIIKANLDERDHILNTDHIIKNKLGISLNPNETIFLPDLREYFCNFNLNFGTDSDWNFEDYTLHL